MPFLAAHFFVKNPNQTKIDKFHNCFKSIRTRCGNPNYPKYSNYGGKGVKCLWTSFEEFKNDMYESYQIHLKEFGEKETTIDRLDSNGNYCKENCRWATRKEQARNRSSNRFIKFRGVRQPIFAWEESLGFPRKLIVQRLHKGWSVLDCILTPYLSRVKFSAKV